MRQSWRQLLFLHWSIEPERLRPLLPPGLQLDTFEGRAYVGLVPFAMQRVRPVWAPALPWLSNFLETNVRTYVHHQGRNPGVWFFSLDVANPVAVALARSLWHLPYFHARMTMAVQADGTRNYRSQRGGRGTDQAALDLVYRVSEPVQPAQPDTLEHFLTERYLLYARRNSVLYRGQVHHQPYPLQNAQVERLDESLLSASAIQRPETGPIAHYATGVDVEVFALEPVEQTPGLGELEPWPLSPAAGWVS